MFDQIIAALVKDFQKKNIVKNLTHPKLLNSSVSIVNLIYSTRFFNPFQYGMK